MNMQEFFLTITPNAEEIAAAAGPQSGPPRRGGAGKNPRQTPAFEARAHRLWMTAFHPEQLSRDDYATKLVSLGGKVWGSDDETQHRVYFNNVDLSDKVSVSCYYDVTTGNWISSTSAKPLEATTVEALLSIIKA